MSTDNARARGGVIPSSPVAGAIAIPIVLVGGALLFAVAPGVIATLIGVAVVAVIFIAAASCGQPVQRIDTATGVNASVARWAREEATLEEIEGSLEYYPGLESILMQRREEGRESGWSDEGRPFQNSTGGSIPCPFGSA